MCISQVQSGSSGTGLFVESERKGSVGKREKDWTGERIRRDVEEDRSGRTCERRSGGMTSCGRMAHGYREYSTSVQTKGRGVHCKSHLRGPNQGSLFSLPPPSREMLDGPVVSRGCCGPQFEPRPYFTASSELWQSSLDANDLGLITTGLPGPRSARAARETPDGQVSWALCGSCGVVRRLAVVS